MDWIFDFLSRFADFINYAIWMFLDFWRDLYVSLTQFFASLWNDHIASWWYTYSLADILPDPGLSWLSGFIAAAAPYTSVTYSLLDYVCYAGIVWKFILLYLQVGIVALAYRVWMLFKRPIPVVG